MSDCNLDGVNMCCWTHGVDIDEADYAEGYCAEGWWEHENEDDREDDFEDPQGQTSFVEPGAATDRTEVSGIVHAVEGNANG